MIHYEPHPSTIAYRAIEVLKALPPGHDIATAPLAEKLDSDTATVLQGLQTATKHGLVVRTRKDGRYHWRIGDKVSKAADPDPEPVAEPRSTFPWQSHVHMGVDIDAGTPRKVTIATPFLVPESPVPHQEPAPAPAAPEQVPVPEDAVAKIPPGSLAPFSFSWRMDGALTISKYGDSVTITADEAAKVRRFLEQVSGLVL